MNKSTFTRLLVGFLTYSVLYFIIGYFFKLPNMCYDNLSDISCLTKSLVQTVFFGLFMMVFDFFVLKKFVGKSNKNNSN